MKYAFLPPSYVSPATPGAPRRARGERRWRDGSGVNGANKRKPYSMQSRLAAQGNRAQGEVGWAGSRAVLSRAHRSNENPDWNGRVAIMRQSVRVSS